MTFNCNDNKNSQQLSFGQNKAALSGSVPMQPTGIWKTVTLVKRFPKAGRPCHMVRHMTKATAVQQEIFRFNFNFTWTYPFDVFAKGLTETGAEDLKLDVGVWAALLKVHDSCQTCDVPLKRRRSRERAREERMLRNGQEYLTISLNQTYKPCLFTELFQENDD